MYTVYACLSENVVFQCFLLQISSILVLHFSNGVFRYYSFSCVVNSVSSFV